LYLTLKRSWQLQALALQSDKSEWPYYHVLYTTRSIGMLQEAAGAEISKKYVQRAIQEYSQFRQSRFQKVD
jgi:hypothetical protein